MEKPVIVIIDDDPNLRKTLSDILQAKGYEPLSAGEGQQGLDLMRHYPVDLVLVDLKLPGISGLEVLERIRADHPHTEAIILTGNATLDSAIKATNTGAFSYLQKPYDIDQLMLHIRRAIEKRQAEKTIRERTAQLEEVNRELESFAYVVSHDLKAPLRAITSLSRWLATDYADKLDQQGREILGLLVERAKRMNSLIEGILHYSRVGRVREEMKLTDLDTVVKDVIDLVAPPGHIAVTIETKLPTLLCEKTRIYQVFQNLISNAVKHMDKPEGVIRIGCVDEGRWASEVRGMWDVGCGTRDEGRGTKDEGGFYTFYVSDNGPGIEERYFDRIFQMFQTLKSRDEAESTGVGLTIVKKIVEMYGGRIWVESKPGEGSTFWFTLPKQRHQAGKD